MFSRVDLLAMNEDEAAALTGEPFVSTRPRPFRLACAAWVRRHRPSLCLCLALPAGARGAYAFADGCWDHSPALEVPVVGTAGAGDALLAGVLTGLVAGVPLVRARRADEETPWCAIESALDLGVALAAFSVTSPHTIHPGANVDALRALVASLGLTSVGPLADLLRPEAV